MSSVAARLKVTARAYKRAEATFEQRRQDWVAVVMEATAEGVPQKDIAAAANVTRETVRRIVEKERKRLTGTSSAA